MTQNTLMTDNTWILIAATDSQSYVAQTTVNEPNLIYRAISKWLIRGSASNIINSFWEYIDQYDNELEDALLDQLVTQADTKPKDPQITNVRTKDYSIDMTVHAKNSSDTFKTCKVEFVLYVYFHSLKKKLRIDEQSINLTLFRSDGKVEKVVVASSTKTPAHQITRNKRVSKRSSKVTPGKKPANPVRT
jgi:hypothetical protein